MSGLLTVLAELPAPEGSLTRVIIAMMIAMGLLMGLVFVMRVPREWSR